MLAKEMLVEALLIHCLQATTAFGALTCLCPSLSIGGALESLVHAGTRGSGRCGLQECAIVLGRELKPYFRCMRIAKVTQFGSKWLEQRGQAESGDAAGASSSRVEAYSALWRHACQPSALARGMFVHVTCLYSSSLGRGTLMCKGLGWNVRETSFRLPIDVPDTHKGRTAACNTGRLRCATWTSCRRHRDVSGTPHVRLPAVHYVVSRTAQLRISDVSLPSQRRHCVGRRQDVTGPYC